MCCTYVSGSHYAADLFHRVKVRTQTTMHREDLLINNGSDWQAVEAIRKSFPQLDVVSALTLVIKPINTVDRCAFVISSENEEVFRIFDLVCQKQTNGL